MHKCSGREGDSPVALNASSIPTRPIALYLRGRLYIDRRYAARLPLCRQTWPVWCLASAIVPDGDSAIGLQTR